MAATGFSLRKWYLDIVTDEGDAAIIYAAKLQVGPVRIGYQNLLRRRPRGSATSRTVLRAPREPRHEEGALHWGSRPLHADGTWTPTCPAVERTVLDGDLGRISWHCLAPGADVTLDDDGDRLRGTGYAEVVTLTAPPWSLPIHELWWGRFVCRDTCLAWIDWRGPHTFRTVLLDGAELPGAAVDEGGVTAPAADLRFQSRETLRQGEIGSTALSLLPRRVLSVLPGRTLLIDETKWISRSTLRRTGRPDAHGWSIHEVVRWP